MLDDGVGLFSVEIDNQAKQKVLILAGEIWIFILVVVVFFQHSASKITNATTKAVSGEINSVFDNKAGSNHFNIG